MVKALQQTDVLIIDECSMVSSRTLSQVSEVLSIKDSTLHFGGIQVILVGDFYQLPPVKDTKYSDSGQYCFENKLIHQFPHRVVLTKVERQSDPTLISACTEVSEGKISADTAKYIYTLNSTNIDPKYKLFATNDLVDDHNRMKILQHKGELVEYISSDSGNTKELARLTVPKVLWLKVCIPVILLRNLSSQLVNGLQGIVMDIGPEGPVVLFAGPNVTMTLKKFNFQGITTYFN